METALVYELPLQVFAFMQLLRQTNNDIKIGLIERRKVCRRSDKRTNIHRRRELIECIGEEHTLRIKDRRDANKEKRRRDRRALERIKKV